MTQMVLRGTYTTLIASSAITECEFLASYYVMIIIICINKKVTLPGILSPGILSPGILLKFKLFKFDFRKSNLT